MFHEGQALVPRLDVASYTGPIQVESLAGRGGGRGVIASRDIQAGDLLVYRFPELVMTTRSQMTPKFRLYGALSRLYSRRS